MTLKSPKKGKVVALNVVKESLNSKSEDDEKISQGKFPKFAKKI